ncbi:MAG: orotidine-5'-phosphate decarboxylase [Pirellulales bacterium]|nr:orotidine-5'-phosphate decarboxylase [Pirellulales bacterium]
MQSFSDRLAENIKQRGNPVLVGLDPRFDSLPESLIAEVSPTNWSGVAKAYALFCREVIDIVAPLVPAVKPQAAFFEQIGPPGMNALADVIEYAHRKDLLVIFDGKRNDIGSTATAYAQGILGSGPAVRLDSDSTKAIKSPWGADALTVNPYLGDDSLQPFIETARERGAGVFVLVKTSNPGGGMFQDLVAEGRPLYRHAAEYVERNAAETLGQCGYGIVGAVVGATYPRQLAELREAMPHAWILVPGFGSQGGTAADAAGAFDERGLGAIVNNSRGIIFAHSSKPYRERFGAARWREAVEAATREMIEQLRANTPAGKLARK